MDGESIFRAALDDVGAADIPALEGPAPPDPPTPAEDGGRGDGHHHHHVHFITPVVMLLSDGSTRTDGWKGTTIGLSLIVAAFVVVWQAVWAVVGWITATSIYGVPLAYLALIFGLIATAVIFGVAALYLAAWAVMAGWRWWRARRIRTVAP